MRKHHLAIILTSAFGESVVAKDTEGKLIFENKYTGLPVLLPTGRLSFNHFDTASIPLKFLVQSIMQAGVFYLISMIQQCRDGLNWFDKLRYGDRVSSLILRLQEESRRWSPDGLPRDNCAVIARGNPRAQEIMDALFLPSQNKRGGF